MVILHFALHLHKAPLFVHSKHKNLVETIEKVIQISYFLVLFNFTSHIKGLIFQKAKGGI